MRVAPLLKVKTPVKKSAKKVHIKINKKRLNILMAASIGITILMVTSITLFFSFGLHHKINELSYLGRIKVAKQKWEYFTKKMTHQELTIYWIETWGDVVYQKNGDSKFDRADCVSGVYMVLKHYGYRFEILNIPSMIKELKRHKAKKVRKAKNVGVGCLIFFKNHIGITAGRTPSGLIRYLDVNGGDEGYGVNTIKFSSRRIWYVYRIPFTMWAYGLF